MRDEASLEIWLRALLRLGFGRTDAVLLGAAHRAAAAADAAGLSAANELALALAPSGELRLETAQQGRSFLLTVRETWPAAGLDEAAAALGPEAAYPVAVGAAAACHGLTRRDVARFYLTALAGNLVSAAIRLAPIGQTAGQRVLARLVPLALAIADEAADLDLEAVGGMTFRADLGSLRHETQYTRLFRS